MSTDAELLHRYVSVRDEAAFAELVRRHLNLVYAAALRRTNGRSHAAEEIVQQVFTDLARKAASLQHHPALTGWLHRSTRYAAIDAARRESRRQKLHQAFTAMPDHASSPAPPADWEQLRPVIDEAMDQLKEADREVILLRYFDGLSFSAVGQRVRLNENAARMRTERALDKLRVQLGRRGVTSSAGALGLALASQALGSAPTGLAASVLRAALEAKPVGTLASLVSTLALQKPVVIGIGLGVAAGIAGVGWSLWTSRTSDQELASLRTEHALLARQLASAPKPSAVAPAFGPSAPVARGQAGRTTAEPSSGRSYQGQATPQHTLLSMAWALEAGNAEAASRLITFTAGSRSELERVFAEASPEVRERYRTPERLFIQALLVSTVLRPPASDEQLKQYITTESDAERVVVRKAGTKGSGWPMVRTAQGWKVEYALTPGRAAKLLKVMDNPLAAQLGIN